MAEHSLFVGPSGNLAAAMPVWRQSFTISINARLRAGAPILIAAATLLWPAWWNGYPLVFADSGTYLSQAVERYLGWDRPVFYSFFLLPLHLTITTWPIIAVQAILTAYTLDLAKRALLPQKSAWWLVPLATLLSFASALPWLVSQIMPDLFSPLLVVASALLVLVPERITRCERIGVVLFSAFMIATHLSNLPLALVLLLLLLLLRGRLGAAGSLHRMDLLCAISPIGLAIIALMAVNLVGFGRASLSPFGNVFVLARVIYDGPGLRVLQRDCPQAGWRLCAVLNDFPADSDRFLWDADGPVVRAGGAKIVSAEADAIIAAALRAEPGAAARAFLTNGTRQLTRFATGGELQPWPAAVTPWIEREFPSREAAAYHAARQTQGILAVPAWMVALHEWVALAGVAACCALLPRALHRRHIVAGFAIAVLVAALANAIVTGGLSMPHDRYQSRVMWLPLLIAVLGAVALLRPRQMSR